MRRTGESDLALLGVIAFFFIMIAGGAFLLTPSDLRGGIQLGDYAQSRWTPDESRTPPPPAVSSSAASSNAESDEAWFESDVESAMSDETSVGDTRLSEREPLPDALVPASADQPNATDAIAPAEERPLQRAWYPLPVDLQEADALAHDECNRQPPREWTTEQGRVSFDASFWGADHIGQTVQLKMMGARPKVYSWDDLIDEDVYYIIKQCEAAVAHRERKLHQQQLISSQRLAKRAMGTAKARQRTAAAANAAVTRLAIEKNKFRRATAPICQAPVIPRGR